MAATARASNLWTVPEVARTLRVHRVTVYRAIGRGELQALRLGPHGRLRVPRSAVEAYVGASLDGEPRDDAA